MFTLFDLGVFYCGFASRYLEIVGLKTPKYSKKIFVRQNFVIFAYILSNKLRSVTIFFKKMAYTQIISLRVKRFKNAKCTLL